MSDKNTHFHQFTDAGQQNAAVIKPKSTLKLNGKLMDLSIPRVMGILNLTPDSFYQPEGRNGQPDSSQILKEAEQMLKEGASFLDLGAYSSRPNAEHINETTESERLLPALKALVKEFPEAIISVDTFRSGIARKAVEHGAQLINDISAGELDQDMFETVASLKVPYILMHMKGTPQTMQQNPHYESLISETLQYFIQKIKKLNDLGAYELIIDPGFGFGKNLEHNYELLNKLDTLNILQLPILAGFSRKSMIYKLLDSSPAEALNGTTVCNTIALLKGAKILRVHDVKPAMEAISLVGAMQTV
jgi:dihydropteroate synthase